MALQLSRAPKRTSKKTSNKEANKPQPVTPIYISSAVAAGSVLTLTFDQPVMLSGTPQFTTDVAGATAQSAVKTAANVVAITFSASIAAATVINLPFREPAIRNASGGFVTSSTFRI